MTIKVGVDTLGGMKKARVRVNRLGVIAFVAGFVLMAFELAGARILAPSIGSSTYVWTSVIGVIIAALSLGYWLGGRVADARGYLIDIARLALLAGLMICLTLLTYEAVLDFLTDGGGDPRWQGVLASLILFAPTSLVLGMMSPYLVKLNIHSLDASGRSVASLSALNSIGGIVGTFVTGFILFGYIGSHETLTITALLMVGISWLAAPRIQWKWRLFVTISLCLAGFLSPSVGAVSIETPSAHYSVYEEDGQRYLLTGPRGAQSGVHVDRPDELSFEYTRQLAEVVEHAFQKDTMLLLGGGAFTLPRYLADKYPQSEIDVVEIDPRLVDIAREHFFYDDPPNINIIIRDARTYLNQTEKSYDIVLVDVYSDVQVPFTFMTREYGQQIDKVTNKNGVVAANMIASFDGQCGDFLAALDAPYREHFGYSRYKKESGNDNPFNMVAAYSRQQVIWPASSTLKLSRTTLYDDNFAPAERLQYDCFLTSVDS